MTKYDYYSTENFLTDPLFRAWVLDKNSEAEAFWQNWLTTNQDKAEVIDEARSVLLTLLEKELISTEEVDHRIRETLDIIRVSESKSYNFTDQRYRVYLRIAAILVMAVGISWLVYRVGSAPANQELASHMNPSSGKIERYNDTNRPQTVLLSDHSTVILQPESRLIYSEKFGEKDREVYLNGEAYFDVFRNPKKPFIVFTDQLITRVLGTSFTVKAFDEGIQASVIVKTGKVSVFTKRESSIADKLLSAGDMQEVVLTPNEQVVYEKKGARLTKSRAQPSREVVTTHHFYFDETPVPEVFKELEKSYGIAIVYDETAMSKYFLTANFSDMPLYEELDLISKIVKGRYEIEDGKVIIYTQ